MRLLIIRVLLQAVKDAETLSPSGKKRSSTELRADCSRRKEDEWKYRGARKRAIREQRESDKRKRQELSTYTDSMRFEFWTEFCDIPVDLAETMIRKITSGEIKPEGL